MTTEEPAAPPANPVIRGEKVYLRPAERSDLDGSCAGSPTRRRCAISPAGAHGPWREERWFDGMVERQGKRDFHFVICLVEDGRAIGTTGLHQIDQESGTAAFGIAIGEKSEWDKGYGTDALDCHRRFSALASCASSGSGSMSTRATTVPSAAT